jgi:ubiquinone/menaquinone biosynthesis C-methylase UbiE
VNVDKSRLAYHTQQWEAPQKSTKAFEEFIRKKLTETKKVIHLGAGTGAATAYLAERHPSVDFTAADYVEEYMEIGKEICIFKDIRNLNFSQVDWYELESTKSTNDFDAVISLQIL